jgi:hypothetical protein
LESGLVQIADAQPFDKLRVTTNWTQIHYFDSISRSPELVEGLSVSKCLKSSNLI